MNCKKYRAYLIGLISAAFICGILIYVSLGKQDKIPAEGTLVQREFTQKAGTAV